MNVYDCWEKVGLLSFRSRTGKVSLVSQILGYFKSYIWVIIISRTCFSVRGIQYFVFLYRSACKRTASFIIWPNRHLVWPFVLCCLISRRGVLVISASFCFGASPIMTNQIQNSIPLSHSSLVYFWSIATSLGKRSDEPSWPVTKDPGTQLPI